LTCGLVQMRMLDVIWPWITPSRSRLAKTTVGSFPVLFHLI
jgi:hypothetical protein